MDIRTCAEISLDAIRFNFESVRNWVPSKTKIMSVVKANAYGHGIEVISKKLVESGTDYLAVANTDEARKIRKEGINCPILVFGNPDPMCVDDYFDFDLDASVSDVETAIFLNSAAQHRGKQIDVHLKVDTGMGRYGLHYHLFQKALPEIAALKSIHLKSIWSHFPNADDTAREFTLNQLSEFNRCLEFAGSIKVDVEMKHIANSAATLYYPEAHFDMVRPGLLLYGYSPEGPEKSPITLKPAMSLVSHVSLIKPVTKGTTVSYGSRWIATQNTELAVIPIGYADGVTRANSNRMKVLIGGNPYQQVGNVTMDNIVVNLGKDHSVKKFDEVTIFGNDQITASTVAGWTNTITWEVLCGITGRVPRVYRVGGK
ncbi:MAG: alanine racemase [Bacteroidetes bacterium]|nr:alanine racemase [Bacteroidota bacterium]